MGWNGKCGGLLLYVCDLFYLCNEKYRGMMERCVVSSVQNPRVKEVVALQQKSAERRRRGMFVVEGKREVERCVEKGLRVERMLVCREIFDAEGGEAVLSGWMEQGVGEVVEVTRGVYERLAYRGGTEGVVAVVREQRLGLEDLQLRRDALVVVMERVEKPGNLGAVLRSADAAGVDALVVCDGRTDLWNPNLIRSSLGAVFTVPCVVCGTEECIAFLKKRGTRILTAQLQDSELYYDTDMRGGTAIVMGSEAEGLTERWREVADAHIRIPMLGRVDSLNVSVSAAILMFEAVRQRQGRR